MSPGAARRTSALIALARGAALLALSIGYFAYVFRLPSGEWRRMGLGDWLDPYFINALLEYWRYSLLHLSSPASPPVFFPARGTLGYSHSLLLYAPFYVIARLWLDPLIAYTVTLFAIIEAGTICLYVIFRRFVRLGFIESLLAAAIFATSANVINGWMGVWSQRASVFLIPPILLLGLWAITQPSGRRRQLGLSLTGFLAVSLFTHDIYTGLLTAIIAALLVAGARLILGWPRRAFRITLWRGDPAPMTAGRRVAAIGLAVIVALSLAVAFQHAYGNIRHRHPGRALAVAAIAAMAFELVRGGTRDRIAVTDRAVASDLAATGAAALLGSVIFVWVYSAVSLEHQGFPVEEMLGHLLPLDGGHWRELLTSPGMLVPFNTGRSYAIVIALCALAWVPWLRLPLRVRLCSLWFLLVTAIVLLIPIRIGRFTPWRYVFELLPGFSTIRDPRRIQYPFELAIALAAGMFLAQLPRGSAVRWSVAVFIAIVIGTNWNHERFDYARPRAEFARFVEAPIAVDASCRSFFVKAARSQAYVSRLSNVWALYANDAAFIATRYAIPTLNGYSAWTPADWHLMNPPDADYASGVAQWISLNRLEHVCELDIEQRTMTPYGAR